MKTRIPRTLRDEWQRRRRLRTNARRLKACVVALPILTFATAAGVMTDAGRVPVAIVALTAMLGASAVGFPVAQRQFFKHQ